MTYVALALSILAMMFGFYAAYLWYLASKGPDIPEFAKETQPQPLEPTRFMWDYLRVLYPNAEKAAALNQQAAIWTGVTAFFAGLASVSSSLQNLL